MKGVAVCMYYKHDDRPLIDARAWGAMVDLIKAGHQGVLYNLVYLRTGEKSNHNPEAITPKTPISNVSRTPRTPPKRPARSAPKGPKPRVRNCMLELTRPSRLFGITACRRLISVMK